MEATPHRHSLQIGIDRHLNVEGQPDALINHACEPSCRIDFDTVTLVAARDLLAHEELTFNYLTCEWEFANPFRCMCASSGCFGFIRGYRYLTDSERARIAGTTAPFLKQLTAAIREEGIR